MRRRILLRGGDLSFVTLTVIVNANVKQIDVTVDGVKTTYTSSTTVQVPVGVTVSWTATANTGYTLSASSGNLGQVTEDKTIAPTASVMTYTLTITINKGVKNISVKIGLETTKFFTSSTTRSVEHGTKVTWTATANDGFKTDVASGTITSMTSNRVISPEAFYNFVWDGQPTVDLGLPSGTIWQTFNVGATKPEEYGLYYQWGDIKGYRSACDESKSDGNDNEHYFSWSTTIYWVSGNSTASQWSKYTTKNTQSSTGVADNLTTLQNEDDAAYVASGGQYRMPTKEDFDELINTSNCDYYIAKCNGVNGHAFISKKNGKVLFLPMGGSGTGTIISGSGSSGEYWSSSINGNNNGNAYYLYFYSGSMCRMENYSRYYGYPIRGVVA